MRVIFSKKFRKDFKKLSANQKDRIDEVLDVFSNDPFDIRLKNHALHGDLKGKRAIAAGGDLRLIYFEENNYETVHFISVGTHNQVYWIHISIQNLLVTRYSQPGDNLALGILLSSIRVNVF